MARPKGAKNKVGANAKDNIIAVFVRLGGTAKMAQWAEENLTEFYRLYARLVPTEVAGKVEHEVTKVIVADASILAPKLERHLANRAGAPKPTVQ